MMDSNHPPLLQISGFTSKETNTLINVLPKILKLVNIPYPLYISKGAYNDAKKVRKGWRFQKAIEWRISAVNFAEGKKGITDKGIGVVMLSFLLSDLGIKVTIDDLFNVWEKGQPNTYSLK